MFNPSGVAVNRAGAGGVNAGDVYVVDTGNRRISEHSATGAFVRAWGLNVVASGPHDGGAGAVNEIQPLVVKATSGTYTLTFSGQTTAPIPFNAPPSGAGSVEAALNALSTIGGVGGSVNVTGGPGDATGSTPYVITFGSALSNTNVAQISANGFGLGVAAGTTLTCSSSTTATTTNFQWLRNGAPIVGATASTYTTATPADAGASIQCQVSKLNANAGSTQVSTPQIIASPVPATVPPGAPESVSSPEIKSGTLTVAGAGGAVLKCNPGSWTGSPTFAYQWYRNGAPLSGNGANTQEYIVQTADLATAAVFQCAVTGTNAGGSAAKVSQNRATTAAPSPAAPPSNTGSPQVSVTGGASASSSTTTQGVGVFEICEAGVDVCKAGESGSSAGALGGETAPGIAIDQANGNLYVLSLSNTRVDVFSAKGKFEGAFGWDVIPPEQQTVTVNAGAGQFNLSFNGSTTTDLAFNATAAQVQSALNLLPSVSTSGGSVTVSGGPGNATGSTPYVVTFGGGPLAGSDVPQMTAANGAVPLSGGGTNTATVTTTVNGTNGTGTSLEFCTTATTCRAGVSGSAAGQLGSGNEGTGLAVDPSSGNVYLTGAGNKRVDEFAPTLNGSKEVTGVSFVHAFGWDVIPTINEKQEVKLTNATGGTFTLTFNGQTTKPTASGDLTELSNEVKNLTTSSPAFTVGMVISGTGIPAGTTITAVGASSLTLSAVVEAGKTATGVALNATLPFNSSSTVVQNALRALSSIGKGQFSGNANVSGAAAGPYTVEFNGPLSGIDQPQMTVDGSALTGASPTATVSTLQNGANGTFAELEVCTAATTCKAGSNAEGKEPALGAINQPTSLAVDSTSAIYVSESRTDSGTCVTGDPARCRVQKFNAAGTSAEEFAPAQLNAVGLAGNAKGPVDIAVDPTSNHVLVAKKISAEEIKVLEFNSAGSLLATTPAGAAGLKGGTTFSRHGLAIGTAERIYSVANGDTKVRILGPPPPPTATINPVTGIASTSATFSGTVKLPAPVEGQGFPTFYDFEYSTNGFTWSKSPAEEELPLGDGSGAGSAESCPTGNPPICNVTQVVTGLQPNTTYVVRLASSTGTAANSATTTFTTKASPPSISRTVAEPVAETSARLTAYVNPNSQATTYHFEWGADASYGTQVPAEFDLVAGSGAVPVKVSANISGLAPHSTYHFRLVAANPSGTTAGPDQEFITLDASGLPDNRAAELVSPSDKRPDGTVEGFILNGQREVYFQAATDGNSVAYPILSGLEDTGAGGLVHYSAIRGESGWQSSRVSPDSTVPALSSNAADVIPSKLVYVSPDLSCQLVETINPVTADTPPADVELGVTNLYLRTAAGSDTLISNVVPANATLLSQGNNGHYYTPVGTSPDCGRIIFQSIYQLLPGTPSGIYEWDHGTLRDAGLRPDGSAAPAALPGGLEGNSSFQNSSAVNAVAPDGRRLFFHATSNQGGDNGKSAVFVRKSLGVTIDASQKQGGEKENNGARYQTASPDGTHLFFTANYGLTSTTVGTWPTSCKKSGEGCDLYDYNVETEQLKDLSADGNAADTKGAEVYGVAAVSDDGSYVYFVASGQLVPGQGNTYTQNSKGFTNVYLSHNGGLAYVATIQVSDLSRNHSGSGAIGISGGNLMIESETRTSQTTPDGRHLLFTSTANVTGYPAGVVPQAYLYSAETGATVCVSCRPDGQPSVGNPSTEPLHSAETEPESKYRIPRSLSADGSRVFFEMPDALAPGAVESPWPASGYGGMNLYEWEQGQVYLLATFKSHYEGGYKDTSASGDDVFVQSPARLDPRYDIDNVRDLYDLRVGGGFPFTPPPPPCNVTTSECQGPETAPPGASSPASEGVSGPGNPPVPPAINKHHPKKHHKKHHKRAHKRHNRAGHDRGGAK